MSKCFVRAVMPSDFACLMAAWLSAYMVVVPSVGIFVLSLSVYDSGFLFGKCGEFGFFGRESYKRLLL